MKNWSLRKFVAATTLTVECSRRLVIFLILGCVFSIELKAADYTGSSYQIGIIRPGGDRSCTLFQLDGVAQADPILPGSPWFVLEPTAPGYKEMVATLLMAKASSKGVNVVTTGKVSSACGHPVVSVLMLP